MITTFLIALVAVEHIYFLALEMFLWTKPVGLKTFRMTLDDAKKTAVMAANQGLYNGFLAAGLIWALSHSDAQFSFQLSTFFLVCVILAAAYGAYSASSRILFVQGLPAALALGSLFLL